MPATNKSGCKVGDIVLPGQFIDDGDIGKTTSKNQVVIGPGLRDLSDRVVATKCGILRKTDKSSQTVRTSIFWVDALEKRYYPAPGETVVGIVTKQMGDYYKVDVRAADTALLHYLGFEGASKKNRQEINVGDAIFGKMVVVSPDIEPELVCINSLGRKENMGVLQGGFIFRTSLHLTRKLLHPKCKLLKALGNAFKYENAIGLNGVIWVNSSDPVSTIAVANAILSAETMTVDEIDTFCETLS